MENVNNDTKGLGFKPGLLVGLVFGAFCFLMTIKIVQLISW